MERSIASVGLVWDHPNAVEAVNRLSDLLFVVARSTEGKSTPSREGVPALIIRKAAF